LAFTEEWTELGKHKAFSSQFLINQTLPLWFTKLALQLTVTFVS